jgi:hypothetical protein
MGAIHLQVSHPAKFLNLNPSLYHTHHAQFFLSGLKQDANTG